MTTKDFLKKIKEWGQTFLIVIAVLGAITVPAKGYADYLIRAAVESKLVTLESRVSSLEGEMKYQSTQFKDMKGSFDALYLLLAQKAIKKT